jgi:hypothetical protein
MSARQRLAVRGYLLHLTHYDPVWYARKSREQPFDLEVVCRSWRRWRTRDSICWSSIAQTR